jgi:hypothetical protein
MQNVVHEARSFSVPFDNVVSKETGASSPACGGKGLLLPSTVLSGDSARTAFTYPQTEIAFNRRFDYNLLLRGEYPFFKKSRAFAPC